MCACKYIYMKSEELFLCKNKKCAKPPFKENLLNKVKRNCPNDVRYSEVPLYMCNSF